MRRTKTLQLGDREVTAQELTVAEIRAWLRDGEAKDADAEVDAIGQMLLDAVSFDDLTRMSDASLDDLEAMTQSELEELAAACQELNAAFFGMSRRLRELASRLQLTGSNAAPAA